MANRLFKISLDHLIGFIKTKTKRQYYSKKQKLQYKKLEILEKKFTLFFKNDLQKCIKIKNILDDFRSKLTNTDFLKFYTELNYDLQIKELLSNRDQTFLYNNDLNSEIFFTDIQYFTQFYKSSCFNLDFLNLSNHYLNLYEKDEIKNVKIQFINNLYEDERYISVKNSKNSLKNTLDTDNMYFSNFINTQKTFDNSNRFLRSKKLPFHSSNSKNYSLESKNPMKKSDVLKNINSNIYFPNFNGDFMQSIYSNPNKALRSKISFSDSSINISNDFLNSKNNVKINSLETTSNNIYFSNFFDYSKPKNTTEKAIHKKNNHIFDHSNL